MNGTASWSYAGLSSGNLTSGASYYVTSSAVDYAGNVEQPHGLIFTFNSVPPTVYIQAPLNGQTYNSLSSVLGTAAGRVGIQTVLLSIQQHFPSGCYDTGSQSFISAGCDLVVAQTSSGGGLVL